MSKNVQEPVMGIPYNHQQQQQEPPPPMVPQPYAYAYPQPQYQQQQQQYYVGQNPYQAGAIPLNAVVGDPKGIPIQQTIYRDSPAPFNCLFCGNSGLTTVRYLFIPTYLPSFFFNYFIYLFIYLNIIMIIHSFTHLRISDFADKQKPKVK